MKRKSYIDPAQFSVKVQVDFPIFSNIEDTLDLRHFLILLKANLQREDLLFFQKEFTQEINERASVIFETLPDDIWMNIFRSLAEKQDLGIVLPLTRVCKRWTACFSNSFTEARILTKQSLNGLLFLNCIRSLSIEAPCQVNLNLFERIFPKLHHLTLTNSRISSSDLVLDSMWSQLTNLKSLDICQIDNESSLFLNDIMFDNFIIRGDNLKLLTNLQSLKLRSSNSLSIDLDCMKHLVHLKKLVLREPINLFIRPVFDRKFGANLELLDSLLELEIIKLPLYRHLRFQENQVKYPHVRFKWSMFDSNLDQIGYYVGDFSDDNRFEGKGVTKFANGSKYEGEFSQNMREGKGILFRRDGRLRYEGHFSKNKREGKGVGFYSNGDKYEGEYKSDKKNGMGIRFFLSSGKRYEGEFQNNHFHGQGTLYFPSGESYTGRFEADRRNGRGISVFPNGDRFDEEFKNGKREGKAICYYGEGTRYEAEFKNDKREGKAVFYYRNGSRYEMNFEDNVMIGEKVYFDVDGKITDKLSILNPF